MSPPQQLPLGVRLRDDATFESFVAGANAVAVHWLQAAVETSQAERAWLWGTPGCGRTHLLQALCHAAMAQGERAMLIDAATLTGAPALLEGLSSCRVVALDDIDDVAGRRTHEEALLQLTEELAAAGGVLVCSGTSTPLRAPWTLGDLGSRLAASVVFRLEALDDAALASALALRARRRGIALDGRTVRYLLERGPRAPAALFALLDAIDRRSLEQRRRVTVPLVREIMAERRS